MKNTLHKNYAPSMVCPKCKKRVFDVQMMPKGEFKIQLKCPNCHRIVTVDVPDLQ